MLYLTYLKTTDYNTNIIIMVKYVDQLSEDPILTNQLWCCISFISPETIKNCNLRGIKVRGVYGTKEEATKRAQFLQSIDPDFNIFVGEVGKWLGWDPDPQTIDDNRYIEEGLQEIVDGFKQSKEKAKILEAERKREIIEESVRKEVSKKSTTNTKDRLRQKLEDSKQKQKMKEFEDSRFKSGQLPPSNVDRSNIKEKEKHITAEKQRIINNEQVIKQSATDLSTVDEKINELQAHYKLLSEKKRKAQQSQNPL